MSQTSQADAPLSIDDLKQMAAWYRRKASESINAHAEDHFKQRAIRIDEHIKNRLTATPKTNTGAPL